MIPLIITVILLLVVLTVLYVPIGIGARYENGAFILLKIAFVKLNIPVNKLLNKKHNMEKETEKTPKEHIEKSIIGLDFILDLLGDFRRFARKRFSLCDFDINISFGTADAASTAVLTGHLWSLSYNLLALIDKLFRVDKPKVNIAPVFNEATFSVRAEGIIKTRIAHIIATAIVFAYKFFKYKRNKTRRKTK